jgi:hypothetical protein
MPQHMRRKLFWRWFRRTAHAAPPPGAASDWTGDRDRETSTNAQTAGAADQPWPGNR